MIKQLKNLFFTIYRLKWIIYLTILMFLIQINNILYKLFKSKKNEFNHNIITNLNLEI